jgi:cell division protein FtsB
MPPKVGEVKAAVETVEILFKLWYMVVDRVEKRRSKELETENEKLKAEIEKLKTGK